MTLNSSTCCILAFPFFLMCFPILRYQPHLLVKYKMLNCYTQYNRSLISTLVKNRPILNKIECRSRCNIIIKMDRKWKFSDSVMEFWNISSNFCILEDIFNNEIDIKITGVKILDLIPNVSSERKKWRGLSFRPSKFFHFITVKTWHCTHFGHYIHLKKCL